MACDWGDTVPVTVTVLSELSASGLQEVRKKQIDSCIADIVRALESAGIRMRGSCCGHGKTDGQILLADGRTLKIIGPNEEISKRNTGIWHLLPPGSEKLREGQKP